VLDLLQDTNWNPKSDVSIARQAKVTPPYVGRLRRGLTQNVLSHQPVARIGRDGRVYNSANIGRKKTKRHPVIDRLVKLSHQFPQFKAVLDETVENLTTQMARTRSPEVNRRVVLSAIHRGCWGFEELMEESGLARKALQKILDSFVASKIVITVERKRDDSNGGRPATLYIPGPNTTGK
jgi:hypothetical protein